MVVIGVVWCNSKGVGREAGLLVGTTARPRGGAHELTAGRLSGAQLSGREPPIVAAAVWRPNAGNGQGAPVLLYAIGRRAALLAAGAVPCSQGAGGTAQAAPRRGACQTPGARTRAR